MSPLSKDTTRNSTREALSVAARLIAVILATFAFAAISSIAGNPQTPDGQVQTADQTPNHSR